MQITKIEKRLKKISALVEMFKLDGKLSQIEKDLLLDYVRKLYDDLLRDERDVETDSNKKHSKKQKQEVKAVFTEKILEEVNEASEKVEEIVEKEPEIKEAEAPVEPVSQILHSYDELFSFDEVKDVSDRLSLSKISNLSKAIGINEKIFTVKQLFGGDNEAYKNTVIALNDLNSMEEAQAYLSENIISTYGWMEDDKFKKAHNFLKVVRRLYV